MFRTFPAAFCSVICKALFVLLYSVYFKNTLQATHFLLALTFRRKLPIKKNPKQTGTQLREIIKSDKPPVFLSSVYSHRFQDPQLLDVTLSATGGKVISYTQYQKNPSAFHLAFVFIGKSRCLPCLEFNALFVVIFSFITLFPHLLI